MKLYFVSNNRERVEWRSFDHGTNFSLFNKTYRNGL